MPGNVIKTPSRVEQPIGGGRINVGQGKSVNTGNGSGAEQRKNTGSNVGNQSESRITNNGNRNVVQVRAAF